MADKNHMGMLGADIDAIELLDDENMGVLQFGDTTKTDPEQTSVEALIGQALDEAVEFYEEELESIQAEATDYYHGRPFGDEKDNRSKVVATTVRDAVLTQLPDLLRVFFGPEHPVELEPDSVDQISSAREATEYVREVFMEDNAGFLETLGVLKDGLVRKVGAFKWWWEEETIAEEEVFEGLTDADIAMLVTSGEIDDYDILATRKSPDGQEEHDIRVYFTRVEGRPRVESVPPEELVWTPNAPKLKRCPLIAHVREIRYDEAIAMGIDEETVRNAIGKQHKDRSSEDLKSARQFHDGGVSKGNFLDDDELHPNGPLAQRPVIFAEAYAKLHDANGDGIAELRKFECIGPTWKIVNGDGEGEAVDEIPFAIFTPDPEPHTMIGLSTFDLLKSNQRITSQIERANLNALARAVEPPTEVVQGEVNLKDLLSPDINGLVRVRRPGMMREIQTSRVDVMPSLAYYNDKKQKQVGIADASAGLDPDTLQSTTRAGVAATVSGSRARTEYVARVFAETCFKPMFRGLFRLIQENGGPDMRKIGGEYKQVDPGVWSPGMKVRINVAIGMGLPEERLQVLGMFEDKIEALLAQGVPFVNRVHLRNVLAKAASTAGYDPSMFFGEWTEEQEQQAQQAAAQQPPPPDPNMMLVEIESQRMIHEAQMAERKFELEQWKAQMEEDRKRDELARDAVLKEHELEAKYAVQIEDAMLKSAVARERAALDADVKNRQNERQARMQAQNPNPTP